MKKNPKHHWYILFEFLKHFKFQVFENFWPNVRDCVIKAEHNNNLYEIKRRKLVMPSVTH